MDIFVQRVLDCRRLLVSLQSEEATMYIAYNVRAAARWAVFTFLILMVSVTALAAPAIIRFDELPAQPAHGLSFQGVTFFFNIGGAPSSDATFGGGGPGFGLFVQDPSLEGNARGSLWLLFPTPTPYLVFGLARSSVTPLVSGAVVDLFDANFSFIARKQLATYPYVSFSENLFYSPPTTTPPVRLVRIVFPQGDTAQRFALDNLTYDLPAGAPRTSSTNAMEAMVRASLRAGFEPALGAPPLPAEVIRQQTAQPSESRRPGPWTK